MDTIPELSLTSRSWDRSDPAFRAAFVGLGDQVAPEPLPETRELCLVMFRRGRPVARAAVSGGVERPVTIGWFAAQEREAAVSLLRTVCGGRERLAGQGARVIGPMDSSTWGRYRLALPGGGDEPAFPGEPVNPPEYHDYFLEAGFQVTEEYESRMVEDLSPRPGAAALAKRLEREGIRFRSLNPRDGERELDALYALASIAFAENPYYQPISREEFGSIYRPPLARIDPGWVYLAHAADGRLLGFALAYSDGGGASARLVLKSVASAPEVRALGLSAALTDQIHARAEAHGYRVIHALMRLDNASASISRRYGGRAFRRYALYEWTP